MGTGPKHLRKSASSADPVSSIKDMLKPLLKSLATGLFAVPLLIPVLCAGLILTAGPAEGADIAAGKQRYALNCVNCHGRAGKGMASFPALLGRDAEYIAGRLNRYRAREKVGPNSAIMMSLSGDLSDADIANLAAYISATFQ